MLIFAPQMRRSLHFVSEELQFEQLWDSDLQCFAYSTKACVPGTLGRASDLLKKIGSERVGRSTKIAVWLSHELGNQVQVSDRLKEFRKLSKLPVDVHLLKMSLVQSFGIFFVLLLRSLDQNSPRLANDLPFQRRPLTIVLCKADLVFPFVFLVVSSNRDPDGYVRVTTSCQAAELGDSAALRDCFPKPTPNCRQIVQESYRVEEVRLPRRIRADQEGTALQGDPPHWQSFASFPVPNGSAAVLLSCANSCLSRVSGFDQLTGPLRMRQRVLRSYQTAMSL